MQVAFASAVMTTVLHGSGIHCRCNDGYVWCRALNSPASSIRARPFDILYNLSLHAELLYSPSRDPNQVLLLLRVRSHYGAPACYILSACAWHYTVFLTTHSMVMLRNCDSDPSRCMHRPSVAMAGYTASFVCMLTLHLVMALL